LTTRTISSLGNKWALAILFYDPVERVVATPSQPYRERSCLIPGGRAWDVNDTVPNPNTDLGSDLL
jgi:hypothetical protein